MRDPLVRVERGRERGWTKRFASTVISRWSSASRAIQDDHILCDDLCAVAAHAILAFPVARLHAAVDVHLATLGKVLPADFRELAPGHDVVEVRGLLLGTVLSGPVAVCRHGERADALSRLRLTHFRISREVADDRGTIKRVHTR